MGTTKKTQVFEWTITNFGCWRESVHDEAIESPEFFFEHFKNVDLYPRGLDDRIGVGIYQVQSDFTADLSFIGPDGSSIFTLKLNGERGKCVAEDGPEFDAAVVALKGNDQLTLRFSFPSDYDYMRRMSTTLDVSKVSLKIDPEFVESLGTEYVYFISHTEIKDVEGLTLQTVRRGDSMDLLFDPANKGEDNNISVECRVSLLKRDNSLVRHGKKEHVFLNGEPWTFSDSLPVKELVEEGITILLDVKITNGTVIENYNHLLYDSKGVAIEPVDRIRNDSTTVLKRDFMDLFRNPEFSDFQLRCDDATFPVHRNILSARSPVFKSMFSSGMREAASGCVDIVDMESSTLASFLQFLYSGAVEDLQEESAFELYCVADKYLVPSLKKKCAEFLSSIVTVSNVCEIASLADRHQDGLLFSAVYDFIADHFDEVSRSDEWKNFMEEESSLAKKFGPIVPLGLEKNE